MRPEDRMLRRALDRLDDGSERQLRFLRKRVDAERAALKKTMSFSRAAAVVTVQQEAELTEAHEVAEGRLQQAEAAAAAARAATPTFVSPELARGDTEEVQMGIRLSDENRRLAAEVDALRSQMAEMIADSSSRAIAVKGYGQSRTSDVIPGSPADGRRSSARDVHADQRDDSGTDPEGAYGGRRATVSPSSKATEEAQPGSVSCGSPERLSQDPQHRTDAPKSSYRSSSGRHASTFGAGVEALLASPSSSSHEGIENVGGKGVWISSSSSGGSDMVLTSEVAGLIKEETEEILAKLKAYPPREMRKFLRAREEADRYAAAARARCEQIRRLPRPIPNLLELPLVETTSADDEQGPVSGLHRSLSSDPR